MILSLSTPKTEQIINQLNNSEFVFQLTGSRYFKNDTHESDWDFFVESSDEVKDFLKELGFQKINPKCSDWADYSLGISHRHYLEIYFSQCRNIHIQLVGNFEHKQMLQEKLKALPEFVRSNKKMRMYYWQLAYHFLPEPQMVNCGL